jgi:hypothetical protein
MLILHPRLNPRDGVIEACDEWTTRVAYLCVMKTRSPPAPATVGKSLFLLL